MATVTLRIEVSIAWWLFVYLHTLVFLCRLFHAEPNWPRVEYWILKGLTVRTRSA